LSQKIKLNPILGCVTEIFNSGPHIC
jgi:hypothetical protein